MTIIEALKSDKEIRISSGRRWLVWSKTYNEWLVMECKYRARTSKEILITEDEAEAIRALFAG